MYNVGKIHHSMCVSMYPYSSLCIPRATSNYVHRLYIQNAGTHASFGTCQICSSDVISKHCLGERIITLLLLSQIC